LSRNSFLSVGALFMGLIVILGAIGIVNGLWSKNLVIHGTVETGDLNADWDCGYTNDDGSLEVVDVERCFEPVVEVGPDTGLDPNNYDWPNFTDFAPFEEKDVGECYLEIGDRDTSSEGFGDQVAYITIFNAYPSYECTVTLFLSNTGSIPFNLISADLILAPESEGIIETVDATGEDVCDPNPLEGTQVDPGTELEFSCTVHVTQIADQQDCTGAITTDESGGPTVEEELCTGLEPYRFAIDVCVAQWNEAADAASCKGSEQHEGPDSTVFPD
jgi:hypothetical protein